MFFVILFSILGFLIALYLFFFFLLNSRLKSTESDIVNLFHEKVSKIPALIEVMRPFVYEERAFDLITSLHSEAMIHDYGGIYNLLEHNARIHDQFLFLLKLSVHIPRLQKDAYFLYIRDFIISYDRNMQSHFSQFNKTVRSWNRFILIKNSTIIGFLLPWSSVMQI